MKNLFFFFILFSSVCFSQPCNITVSNPQYGDVWYVGQTYTIQWTTDDPYLSCQTIILRLKGEGTSGVVLVDEIPNITNNNYYNYTVPSYVLGYPNYFFEFVVILNGEEFYIGESPYFYIQEAPCDITITSPKKDDVWYVGKTYDIKWNFSTTCQEQFYSIVLFGVKSSREYPLDSLYNVPNDGSEPYTPSSSVLGYDYYFFLFRISMATGVVDIARSQNFYIQEEITDLFSVFPQNLFFLLRKNSSDKKNIYIIPKVEKINFNINSNQQWLFASPSSGTIDLDNGPQKIEISVFTQGLNEGNYNGAVTIIGDTGIYYTSGSSNGINIAKNQKEGFSQTVNIFLQVVPETEGEPDLEVDKNKLIFNYKLGENPPQQNIILKNNGNGIGYFMALEYSKFLSLDPTNGSLNPQEEKNIVVSINKNFEEVGTFKGFIEIVDQFGKTLKILCIVNVRADYGESQWEPSSTPTQTLPIAATGLGGAYGSFWSTDISATLISSGFVEKLNSIKERKFYSEPTTREKAAFIFGAIGKKVRTTGATVTEFELNDQFPSSFYNYLKNFCGMDSFSGFIQVRGDEASRVAIFSRTYTTDSQGKTYGQFIGGVKEEQTIRSSDEKAIVFGLRNDQNFRSNLFVTELNGYQAEVTVKLYNHLGQETGSPLTKTLEGFSQWQIIDVFGKTGSNANWAYAEIKSSGDGKIYAFGSVIDNKTNDPVTLPSVIPSNVRALGDLYFPAVVRTPGAYGTNWRTDLVFMNYSESTLNIEIELHSPSGDQLDKKYITILPKNMGIYLDSIKTLFGREDGMGSLIVKNVDTSKVYLFGRIYNLNSDGSTYGQGTISFNEAESTSLNENPIFAMGMEASDYFRTNVGAFEVSGSTAKVLFTLIFPDGESRNFAYNMKPYEWVQINNIIKAKAGYEIDVSNVWVVLSVIEGNGKIVGYSSIVDNLSSDATFVKLIKP